MSTRYRVDVEVFQTFLANAFAVQESGLDRRSLSALIEIQRFMANEQLELDRALQMIVDRALGVSHASGVSIGLLEANKNELVYRAASGSAASDLGRRVPAVLSASAIQESRREILRVENAASDTRIEAEICRQFGAVSLLMLPIYRNHVLEGVMQVLFDAPHSFHDGEVRAYRLMIGALEEGMARSLNRALEPVPVSSVQAVPEVAVPEEVRSVEPTAEPSPLIANFVHDVSEDYSLRIPQVFGDDHANWFDHYEAGIRRAASAFRSVIARTVKRAASRPFAIAFPDAAAAVGVVMVLGVSIWIFHRNLPGQANILPVSTAHDAQLRAPANGRSGEEGPMALGDQSKEMSAPNHGFRRVRIGPNEVDYVSEDVTIRTFETRHAQPQLRGGVKEVNLGDDVTVRYFAKSPARLQPSSAPESTPEKN